MLLVRPCHGVAFLRRYHLGVEAHINRTDLEADWASYVPFVHGVHLPYAGMNLASFDDAERQRNLADLKLAFHKALAYPVDRMVLHTVGYRLVKGEPAGSYERLVDGLRDFVRYAQKYHILICLENQVRYPEDQLALFGCTAREWFSLQRDVNEGNCLLTLDTSHAATSVAAYDKLEDRRRHLEDFLASPELIGRVHWSDSVLAGNRSLYNDMHLVPGEGDLPRDFHRRINELPVVKLLEQTCSDAAVVKGLEFIAGL